MSDNCSICGSVNAPVYVLLELASFGGAGYTSTLGRICADCADRVVSGELIPEVKLQAYDAETGIWH